MRCTKKLFNGGEAKFVKVVSPGDSDSFSSGVYNSGFKQLFGEVAGFHVDDRIYESQLSFVGRYRMRWNGSQLGSGGLLLDI